MPPLPVLGECHVTDLISWLRQHVSKPSGLTKDRHVSDADGSGFAAGTVWGVMFSVVLQMPAPWWGRAIALTALAAVAVRRVMR